MLTHLKCNPRPTQRYQRWRAGFENDVASALDRINATWRSGRRFSPGEVVALAGCELEIPSFDQIAYWFPPQVIAALAAISSPRAHPHQTRRRGAPLTTKLHPYSFAAKDDVAVAVPNTSMSPAAMIFIQAQLNAERWRFSYYRKCFRAKLGRMTVELPIDKDGDVDFAFMEAAVEAQPYWWFLAPRLKGWSPTTSPNSLAAQEADLAAAAEAVAEQEQALAQ